MAAAAVADVDGVCVACGAHTPMPPATMLPVAVSLSRLRFCLCELVFLCVYACVYVCDAFGCRRGGDEGFWLSAVHTRAYINCTM